VVDIEAAQTRKPVRDSSLRQRFGVPVASQKDGLAAGWRFEEAG